MISIEIWRELNDMYRALHGRPYSSSLESHRNDLHNLLEEARGYCKWELWVDFTDNDGRDCYVFHPVEPMLSAGTGWSAEDAVAMKLITFWEEELKERESANRR